MARDSVLWKLAVAGCVVMTAHAAAIAQEYDADLDGAETYDAQYDDADFNALDDNTEIIRERYDDRSVKIERSVTKDENSNYIDHGPWKMFNQAGTVIAEGQFEHGKRHGVWTRWHTAASLPAMFKQAPYNTFSAPFVSQATFADGKLSGHWTVFDAKQRRASEFELSDGRRHGMSTWWYPSGAKMREAFYRNGVVDGELIEWNAKSVVTIKDNYQEGRKLAAKTTYYKNSTRRGRTTVRSQTGRKKTEGMYLFATSVVKTVDDWWEARPAKYVTEGSDLRHGAWTEWFESGHEQLTGNFQNDVQVGTFVRWFENGQTQAEGDFANGKPHGHWTFWHPNGQRHAEGIYKNGDRIGEWSEWHNDGKLAKSHDYSKPEAETAEAQPSVDEAGPQF